VERPFEVRPPKTAAAGPVEQAATPTPLAQLRAGQIDVERYLDLKVDEATRHLHGLTPIERESIRGMLRDQIATDPALVDMVRQAAGKAPRAPDE
jgi:hypothetical protein